MTRATIVLLAKILAVFLVAVAWSAVGMLLGDAVMHVFLLPGFVLALVIAAIAPSLDERGRFLSLTLYSNILPSEGSRQAGLGEDGS